MNKTIFCDIDGTLVKHFPPFYTSDKNFKMELLENTINKLYEWYKMGYNIILTTGRKEGMRKITEKQLSKAGIIYDKLIMGLGSGPRYLINDRKKNGEDTAFSYNINRDYGIKDIDI